MSNTSAQDYLSSESKPSISLSNYIPTNISTNATSYSIFNSILAFFAIYLSFKCNHGFAFGDLLFACCCPVFYILYRAGSSNFCTSSSFSNSSNDSSDD